MTAKILDPELSRGHDVTWTLGGGGALGYKASGFGGRRTTRVLQEELAGPFRWSYHCGGANDATARSITLR
jgi:hypothetical protein